MNDLISLVKEFLELIGIENKYIQLVTSTLIIVFVLFLIGKQIFNVFKFYIDKRRNKLLEKDLHPFYSEKEVENATKYYIKTQFQNIPPSEDEEPGRSHIAAARQPLIPLFLNKAFKNDSDDNKYYLVLADSGMGKTTFMINLYLSYKYRNDWFWQKAKYNIKLFPMGHPKTIERIKGMSMIEKENSILLLDAFDEDNEAVINYEKRLNEILDIVWEFREVVITCRTQFFPSAKSEPTETGKFKFGPNGGEYHFQKIYVSVFSENDIKRYLKKRFKSFFFYRSSKYLTALGIVLKSPNLMMRPMLLSHVDDLINAGSNTTYGFQIYEALIDQWLNRESDKAGVREKYGNDYKDKLYEFSKALARDLYLNREKRNNKLSLKVNEIIDNPDGLQLNDIEGNRIGIDKYDQGSRSLLNRNAIGEYKFSHKSILEYFLALEVFSNSIFRKNFFFDSDLDTAKFFFIEMFLHKKASNNFTPQDLNCLGFTNNEIIKIEEKEYTPKSSDEILWTLKKALKGRLVLTFTSLVLMIITTFSLYRNFTELETRFRFIIGLIVSIMSLSLIIYLYYKRILKKLKDQLNNDER